MKIISKYKDYYDYLSDIYGIDPLLILDRRDSEPIITYNDNSFLKLYVGGYKIEIYVNDGIFYCGDRLWQFDNPNKPKSNWTYSKEEMKQLVYITYPERYSSWGKMDFEYIDPRLLVDDKKYNEKFNCPILLQDNHLHKEDLLKYPILSEIGIPSFINASDMFKIISDWLSNQRTIAENHADNRSNDQKIQCGGFDAKTSFRPNMKDI